MVNILRAVIDTNHIISSILSARGASAKLINWLTQDEEYFKALLSEPIWQEYRTVADWLIPPSKTQEKQRILTSLLYFVKLIMYPFNILWCVEAIHELLLHLPSLIERILDYHLHKTKG